MLFCFGLFALLLYYTVVANAECSYTYRHSSQQPIEARSWEFQKQGFTRCQFLIQLVNKHQQLRLNFTRLTGFGASLSSPPLPLPPSHHGTAALDRQGKEEEKEEEEEDWMGEGGSQGREGDRERLWPAEKDSGDQSQRSRLLASSSSSSSTTKKHHPEDVERGWRVGGGTSSSTILPEPGQDRSGQDSVFVGSGGTTTPGTKTLSSSGSSSSSASSVTTMWPVLGGGEGLGKVPDFGGDDVHPCLPMLEIRTVDREGREEMMHRICRQPDVAPATSSSSSTTTTTHTPIVFHYSSSVRIVYEWALGHHSGFTLFFHFSNVAAQPERCVHTCDGATRCLSERRMLCDGRYDCRDRSDEHTTVCRLSTSPSASRPLDEERLVQIVVIPSCAVAVVVLLSAVCLIGHRRWHHGPHAAAAAMHHHRGQGHHHATSSRSCLQSHSSESSVTRACSTQECSEQAVALLSSSHRSSHISWPSSQTHPCHHPSAPHPPSSLRDPHIELPPNIPVSPDGEEGYVASQQSLRHPRYHSANSDLLFRPPPNKTVFDRESPPPYSVTPSSPPGTYGSRSAPCPSPVGMAQGGQGWSGHEQVLCDSVGQSKVSRSRSAIMPSEPPPLRPPGRGVPLPRSSANPGCASPDPQTFPLLHGACRKTDTQSSPPAPPQSHVVPVSCSPSPASCCSPAVSSSSSPAFSSASCSAALLPSSSEEAASVFSSPSHSRTTFPCQLVCSAGAGQNRESSNSSSGDSSGEDRPRASHPAQLGAPASSCQGAFSWTREGEDTT